MNAAARHFAHTVVPGRLDLNNQGASALTAEALQVLLVGGVKEDRGRAAFVAATLVDLFVRTVQHHAVQRALVGMRRCGVARGIGTLADYEIAQRS